MPKRETEYWNEGMDAKRFILCVKSRIWLVLAAALAGALFGGALYLIVRQASLGPEQYQAEVLFSIGYDVDVQDEVLKKFINEYNAYTWGDMMKSDKVVLPVMAALPGVDRAVIEGSVTTEIASDPEFLTARFTTGDGELSNQIAAAYCGAMAAFGETMRGRGLTGIEAWKTVPAKAVEPENRVLYAAELGAVIGLIAGALWLAGWYVLDDSVLLMSDIVKKYGCPVLGYRTRRPDTQWDAPLCANLEYMAKKEAFREVPYTEILKEDADFEALRETPVVLLVEWRTPCLRVLDRVIQQLGVQDITLCGVIITETDNGFLRSYYGRGKRK